MKTQSDYWWRCWFAVGIGMGTASLIELFGNVWGWVSVIAIAITVALLDNIVYGHIARMRTSWNPSGYTFFMWISSLYKLMWIALVFYLGEVKIGILLIPIWLEIIFNEARAKNKKATKHLYSREQ